MVDVIALVAFRHKQPSQKLAIVTADVTTYVSTQLAAVHCKEDASGEPHVRQSRTDRERTNLDYNVVTSRDNSYNYCVEKRALLTLFILPLNGVQLIM